VIKKTYVAFGNVISDSTIMDVSNSTALLSLCIKVRFKFDTCSHLAHQSVLNHNSGMGGPDPPFQFAQCSALARIVWADKDDDIIGV
jgi:hypothetical protein